MKVRFKHSVAGGDFMFGAGEEADIPSSLASSLLRFGHIEILEADEPPVRPLRVQEIKNTPAKRRTPKKRGRPKKK